MGLEWEQLIHQADQEKARARALQIQALKGLGKYLAEHIQVSDLRIGLGNLKKQAISLPGLPSGAKVAVKRAFHALEKAGNAGVPQTFIQLSVAEPEVVKMSCRNLGDNGMYIISPLVWGKEWDETRNNY